MRLVAFRKRLTKKQKERGEQNYEEQHDKQRYIGKFSNKGNHHYKGF